MLRFYDFKRILPRYAIPRGSSTFLHSATPLIVNLEEIAPEDQITLDLTDNVAFEDLPKESVDSLKNLMNSVDSTLSDKVKSDSLLVRYMKSLKEIQKCCTLGGALFVNKPTTYHNPKNPVFSVRFLLPKHFEVSCVFLKANIYLGAFSQGVVGTKKFQWLAPSGSGVEFRYQKTKVSCPGFGVGYRGMMVGASIVFEKLRQSLRNMGEGEYTGPSYDNVCLHIPEMVRFGAILNRVIDSLSVDEYHEVDLNEDDVELFKSWSQSSAELMTYSTVPKEVGKTEELNELLGTLSTLLFEDPNARLERRKEICSVVGFTPPRTKDIDFYYLFL